MARKKVLGETGLKRLIYWVKQTMGPLTRTEYEGVAREFTISPRNGQTPTIVNLKDEFLELLYPVGTVIHTVDDINPADTLGGTWSKIRGRMLIGAGGSYMPTNTGGSATFTLRRSDLPNLNISSINVNSTTGGNHTHMGYWEWGSWTNITYSPSSNSYMQAAGNQAGTRAEKSDIVVNRPTTSTYQTPHTHTMSSMNGNVAQTAVNKMPEYLSVYTWRRTA